MNLNILRIIHYHILADMFTISYSNVVYVWHMILFVCIHDSSPVESFTPVKCCLTSRGTEFGKVQCNISGSESTVMNGVLQKSVECLTTCLKVPQCQTYEYDSDNCRLGFKIYQDCFSYLVNTCFV